MATIETKETNRQLYETTTKTVKSIVLDRDYYTKEANGVIKLLNEAWTLDILVTDLKHKLRYERDGVKAITELKPNTELEISNILNCNTDWLLNEDLYNIYETDNTTILITEETIKRAKYMVKQYNNLINILDCYLKGCYSVSNMDREVLGLKE